MSSHKPLMFSPLAGAAAPAAGWRARARARLQRQASRLFLTAEGLRELDGDGLQHAAADWASARAGQALELIVSARLLHELICEPGLPLGEEEELQAYGHQQFAHYFGAAARNWPLASWRADKAGLGLSALHGLDWAGLQYLFEQQALLPRRVRPAWAPLLHQLLQDEPEWARAPRAGLAWVEGQVLTWLQLEQGRLQGLRQLRLAAATRPALLEALGELKAELQVPLLVQGFGLDAAGAALPAAAASLRFLSDLSGVAPQGDWFASKAQPQPGWPDPDFLGPRQRRWPLAWPLALSAALVLGTAVWGLQDSRQNLDLAQQQAQRLTAEVQRLGGSKPSARKTEVAAVAKRGELDALRGAQEAQKLLQQAWEPLLSNIEQAGLGEAAKPEPGGISWLSLDYSAARGELRLEGLASDKLLALQLADRLGHAPGWRQVMLSRFQTAEQGLSGQRFELTARLRPELLQPDLPGKDKP
ncbi:hypothetical protein HNP55_001259 [Paucibacter oligotrophus]|uniref:Uncharacterized protein n=2 Tax=Roseateles oligotrophus TaxID=1769250 RepID=A0A840L2P5_9BURK|nr:hypothetical protein [Roseateles oligotrophus]